MKVQESTRVWDTDKCMKIADHVILAEKWIMTRKREYLCSGKSKKTVLWGKENGDLDGKDAMIRNGAFVACDLLVEKWHGKMRPNMYQSMLVNYGYVIDIVCTVQSNRSRKNRVNGKVMNL